MYSALRVMRSHSESLNGSVTKSDLWLSKSLSYSWKNIYHSCVYRNRSWKNNKLPINWDKVDNLWYIHETEYQLTMTNKGTDVHIKRWVVVKKGRCQVLWNVCYLCV